MIKLLQRIKNIDLFGYFFILKSMNINIQPYNQNFFHHWIEISQSAIEHNADQFTRWLGPDTQIAAVIKSNAYGHGLLEMASLYQACNNIAALCVINLSEAVMLRQHNILKPIFVIGYLDAPYDLIAQYNIEVILYDLTTAQQLHEIGKAHQTQIKVHIKFDTGMSRLGVQADQLHDLIHAIENLEWLKITAIFTHLAQGYDEVRTQTQEKLFLDTLLPTYPTHISNSHGSLIAHQGTHNFARIGIGLYGYLQKHTSEIQNKLKPVLSLKTKILQIKSVRAGSLIGYDGLFQASTDMKIAILAIGYHEGLDARLSNSGSVIINEQFAPIIGRVCMNLTIVDVSNITNCSVGQTVTLLGTEGNISISAYDWSKITQASAYNLLTKLSSFVPKIIIQ